MITNRVLIFVAHPDDEVLGCGGTIAFHRSKGDDVAVCYLSEGVSSRYDINKTAEWIEEKNERERMAIQASNILDFEILYFLSLPNLRMEDHSNLDLVKKLIKIIDKFDPKIVYTHFPGDLNTDHQITFKAVFTALRPNTAKNVKVIRCFEVLSSTEWAANINEPSFRPDTYVDVTDFINKKFDSVKAYEKEMRSFPHPRSEEVIRSLMQFRGSQVGFNYAEAFVTIRNLID
jgi:LmbE family N-acetylglucosaminyl deacetylase